MKILSLKQALLAVVLAGAIFMGCEQVEKNDLTPTIENELKTSTPIPCFDPYQVDFTANCGDVVEPVCACLTITFENQCQAEAAGFYNISDGPCSEQVDCKSELVDEFFDENWQCATVYDPVCGCNGQTYSILVRCLNGWRYSMDSWRMLYTNQRRGNRYLKRLRRY
jgi:hypothetical protein